jgi:positive regulator of sigma E activity
MRGEDFFEEGIVVSAADGSAVVRIQHPDTCEECSAKLFCTPGEADAHTVTAMDPLGVHSGDAVRILVRGENVFRAAAMLYGVPLVLLLAGLLLGMNVIAPLFLPRELFAFACGLCAAGTWYLGLFLSGGAASARIMPEIVARTAIPG